MLLSGTETVLSGLACDLALDIVEGANPVERVLRDRRTRRLPLIVKVAAKMRPARRLANASTPVHGGLVELPEAAIGIGLQHARKACEMRLRVFAFPVFREVISDARRIAAAPGSIIADIDPYAAFLDAFRHRIRAFAREIEDLDRGVVDMQAIRSKNLRLDQVAQRPERRNPRAASIDQGRARNIRAKTRENFALPIQG